MMGDREREKAKCFDMVRGVGGGAIPYLGP